MSLYYYADNILSKPNFAKLMRIVEAQPLPYFDGMHFRYKGSIVKLEDNAHVMCFGKFLPQIEGATILNTFRTEANDKYLNLSISRHVRAIGSPVKYALDLTQNFNTFLKKGYVPCRHLPGYVLPYWKSTEQYRVHVFNGRAILIGKGTYNKARTRSKFNYSAVVPAFVEASTNRIATRDLMLDSVIITGFSYNDGYADSLFVRKVSTYPAIETDVELEAYATAIQAWYKQVSVKE